MPEFSFVLLYVENPAASADFYAGLLGHAAIEQSPTFVMFALRPGVMLGLWARDAIVPPATASGGGEIAFTVSDAAEVSRVHDSWLAKNVKILQPPTAMDFGTTFTACDPDGHRLRVFAPAA